MKLITLLILIFLLSLSLIQCGNRIENLETSSPDGKIKVNFFLSEDGTLGYSIDYSKKRVIDTSYSGFDFQEALPFKENLEIINSYTSSFDETWETVWGEQRFIRNNYNELKIELKEKGKKERRCFIVFRVFDDGVGFRFEFPHQENFKNVVIVDENTQFKLTGDHTCWWIPGDWDIYEHLFNTTKFSEIDALSKRGHESLAQTYIPENAVSTPVSLRSDDGIYISILEANLTNYSEMTLKVDKDNFLFQSELVGNDSGIKVKAETPFLTPWRLILIGDEASDLVSSRTILNLNEPNIIEDVSWIKPTKYIGIWWEMHIGKSTWDMQSGRHGATTENAKRYIDFAAKNRIGAVLIEGWNTGWENWFGTHDREGIFDFVTPYPDYDLNEVVRYAKEKKVQIIMHHETSAAIMTYEKQLDTAFALCRSLGIHAVKTGYVGQILPDGEYHFGQWMINHFTKVMEKAAEYQIMINIHEGIKQTGLRRTYPNMMSAEGLRGQEFNAWSNDGGNPPEHLTIVPFTRMLAGPIDYTPGIFEIKFDKYKKENQVNTTLAHQLALYVVIYSPLQMAADLPENYSGHPAFQFIRDVGVDWDTSIVLNGEIGDFITIVRKERNTDKWFLGSITDENERVINISLNFLDIGKKYTATIYSDNEDSHWDKNPTAYKIESKIVNSSDKLTLKLAPGGGTAISFISNGK
ncbi:MAG TPA: glycoside hydrolase family 97 protein [Ignavibacteriaceae bacterium]|nr:glycoside hydrolase family 97 protein [Ignavibacteriaceae bacterium]